VKRPPVVDAGSVANRGSCCGEDGEAIMVGWHLEYIHVCPNEVCYALGQALKWELRLRDYEVLDPLADYVVGVEDVQRLCRFVFNLCEEGILRHSSEGMMRMFEVVG
jgi:hypothetical protein